MTAYALMAALALLAMLLLTRPWWSRRATQAVQRRGANIASYRTRLAEIEGEVASGILEAEVAASLKQELGSRLLSDTESFEEITAVTAPRGKWMFAISLALLLPLLASVGYFYTDSWRTQQTIDEVAAHPESAQKLTIEAMVQRLERRLAKSPDDAEGWSMLGRSYFVTTRYASAADAYHKANALNGGAEAETLAAEGEALTMANSRDLSGVPASLFEKALKLDAQNVKALWYGGLAAAQARNFEQAMAHWLKLRQQNLPPEMAQALEDRLQELSQISGLPVPKSEQVKAPTGVSLKIKVRLAADLSNVPTDGATLLVFAKAAEGPPMPLAVQKITSFKLPMDVVLDDSMAMMPQLKLSQFPRWVLTARITRSGDVRAQAGDLQGQMTLDAAMASRPIDLVISEPIKNDPH